ncbi:MAG TPA: DNA polymerase III subunit alpha [Phycisphaerae bacterium]|nr:DNA polymerase III subunit alpha [Phycisphaerae bacterium]HDZ44195.1 DNA polymerase III subunit alpha [Phycisphaerae bacterium]
MEASMDGFTHLHVHSHYSLLDGANRIGDLVAVAGEFGMDALALTDHGNLFGAVDFYTAATEAGIKPILGLEAYISPTTRQDRTMANISAASSHVVLLAMNQTGWRNLMKLSSRAYLEGFYYRPRIDRELLAELNEGLICMTACLGGQVPSALLSGKGDQARTFAGQYLDIFGRERFFIELQDAGLPEQRQVNPLLLALADELGVEVVGTNDVHFLRRDDKRAHEVLTCIATGRTLDDPGRLEYSEELYLKSPAEMRQVFAFCPRAADNTLTIAEMCDVKLDFSAKYLPSFATPDGKTADQYIRELAEKGLRQRFDGGDPPVEYRDRLDRELRVIADKGYSSYFLIVNDFVQFAHANSIPAAPRGSGVATLLGYALGIANVDPIHYGLLFERFTDPQRDEDPDMDIDICQDGRARVLQYVREKYGHVAQVITYGTLKPRAVLRDVGRVMGMPIPDVDVICKKIPEGLNVTLDSALESEPELQRMVETDDRIRQMVDYGRSLEGLARHSGVHAAAVIVADQALENLLPLCRQADSEDVITQWDGPTCEKIGLMKMDFLGLRTLSIIQRAHELVRDRTGEDIDPEKLTLDDPAVFELFCAGQTDGVFQFESEGMKNVLTQMRPNRIEDLIAANAMYRPGPMELIPSYCARKHQREAVPSVHKLVDDVLAETYGVMCYQEQVMQVLSRLGQFPLSRALTLIKAISKKKEETIAAERPNFITGAKANGIVEGEAQELFDLILRFAGYGFNKAHSTRYAIVAYQTAYFKVHHPLEFMAALLTFESGDTDKVVQYMSEAARMKVGIAPPDINTCGKDFAVDGDSVRFGLAAVKGVGAKAVDAILADKATLDRPFRDLFDFCEHVDVRAANRATLEALIKCGAFDALGAHRAAMMAALDQALSLGQSAAADRQSGQLSMFAVTDDDRPAARFPDVEPWSEAQLLTAEKETLGFYVSSHPLVKYGRELASLTTPPTFALARTDEAADRTPVCVGCTIAGVRRVTTRSSNRRMAMLTLEDLTGKCDAVVFPDTYEQLGEQLVEDALVFVIGAVDRSRDRPNILVNKIIPIDQAIQELTQSVLIRLPGGITDEMLEGLKACLSAHPGPAPVHVELQPQTRGDVRATVRLDAQWSVQPSRQLADALIDLLGDQKHLVLLPKRPTSDEANGQRRRRGRAKAAASQTR